MIDLFAHQVFLVYVAIGVISLGIAYIMLESGELGGLLVALGIGVVLAPGLCAYFFGDEDQEKWVAIAGLAETPFVLLVVWFFFWGDYKRLLTCGFLLAIPCIAAIYPVTQLLGMRSPDLLSFGQTEAVTLGLFIIWCLGLYATSRFWKHELQTAEPYRGEAVGADSPPSVA